MTLAITGRGVDYNVTAGADADGKVTFTVPAIVTGTEVTVTLVVKAADGSVLFAGSKTQVLDGSASPLSISLSRQYWAMPASISAAASPSTIAYEPSSVDSDSVTFNIIGLSDAPAGVTYSWTDESGNAVGSGPTLTRTVSQMLGGSVPSSETLEKAYSVTVSYTDASGESRTLTASAAATIVTTTTLTLEGSGIQASGGRMVLAVPKGSAAVSLHADVLCFGGTPSYSWALADGSAAAPAATLSGTTGQDNSVSFGPAGGSATVTVSADLGDGRILTRELYVYVLDAVISCGDIPAGGTAAFITEAATDSTVMTASLSGIASLPGVTYEWQTDDIAVALTGGAAASEGEAATITPVAAGSTTVRLRASYLGVSSGWRTQELKVAGLRITLGGAAAGDVLMELSDTTGKTLSASVVNGSGTASFTWAVTEGSSATLDGTTGSSRTLAPGSAGGKSVVTVSTNVNGRTLSKELTVYVFDLALSGGTSLSAPTPPDTSYSLMMTTSDTAGKTVTASLNGSGMPAVTYSWTCADPALNYIIMDDSNSTSGTFTVKPKAAGTTSFSVMAYYNGSLTPVCSRTVDVTVAGVTITGSPVVKKGGTAVTLGATFQGFTTTPTVSSWSWAWKAGSASLATITSPASSTPSLTSATEGGKTTLTVSAVVGGITLTAEKDIYVLDLKVSAPEGCETDASGNPKLNYGGTLDLTASLTGLTAADLAVLGTLSYSWSSGDAAATPPVPERASFSPDNAASTSASPISGDSAPVPLTITVSWTGNATAGIAAGSMDASIDVSIPNSVSLENLADYLASLPVNDKDHPYTIPNITGLVSSGMSSTALPCQLDVLKTCGRYLDLSGLTLTEDNVLSYVTAFGSYKLPAYASDQLFRDNKYIVSPPVISQPSGGLLHVGKEFWGCTALETIPAGTITNAYYLEYTFEDCKNLTDASGLGISPQVYNMFQCFYNCKKLTTLPSIPTSVATYPMNMQKCFYGCEALQDASSLTIATSQNMDLKQCFYGCKKLTTPPAIQDTNSSKSVDMTSCFEGCEKLASFPTLTISGTVNLNSCFKGCKALTSSGTITMPSRITDMTSCFEGCTALSGTTIIFPSTSPTDPSKWTDAFKGVLPSQGVTVQVPDCGVKAAIESASGNSGVTVVVAGGCDCASGSCP